MEEKNQKLIKKFPPNTCLACYRGSVAHNTYIPSENPGSSDDIDLLGVHFFKPNVYLGIHKKRDVYESFIDEYDVVSYEFKKLVSMLLKANPNVMPVLFLNKEHYIYSNFYGRALLDNKELFLSKKIYRTFVSYAGNQLKKLYKDNFEGYMGQKRKQLVKKFGFDPKHASHCIRLLKMGSEFVATGRLNVCREKDAQYLIDVKLGKIPLAEIKEQYETLFNEAEEAYSKWDFPEEPETEKILKLTEEIMYDYIKSNYQGE